MPTWLKTIFIVLGVLILVCAIACLTIFCIATAKDMTFVEYIKSWFPAKETAKEVASVVSSFIVKR